LMDLRMKPVDGLRATAEIKARLPEIRVIIVSQDDDAGLRAKAARAGACAYVLKENLQELPGILTADQ
jgi:DNA-binding NarL/FixJ family response regulator